MGAFAEIDHALHSLTQGVVDMKGFLNSALAILLGAHFRGAGTGLPSAARSPVSGFRQPPPMFGRGVAKQKRAAMKAKRVAAHRMACR
jgi:hypothetical protein